MNILKELEQRLMKNPQTPENRILGELVKSLCMGSDFKVNDLYELNHTDFEIALKVMKNWRTSRYTKTRERLKGLTESPPRLVEEDEE
jgi:hypothetical protein